MLVDTHCHLHLLELDDPVAVELPLRGEWSVERTPAYRIPSHGTNLLGQRYAYDLVRTDHRSGSSAPAGSLRVFLLGDGRGTATAGGRPKDGAQPMRSPVVGLMLAVASREAGNPVGNPVVVTVPAGMQPGGRRTQRDLRRWPRASPGRRVVSHF